MTSRSNSNGVDLIFDEATHTYTRPDGTVVPSVTTVLKAMHSYKASSVKQGKATCPKCGNCFGCEWVTDFFTPQGQDRGTTVHQLAEKMFRREPIDVPVAFKGYITALSDWQRDVVFEPSHIEERVDHQGFNYCGTVDLIGNMGTESPFQCLIDIKTGSPDASTGLQLAAYALAFFFNKKTNGEEREKAIAMRRFAIHPNKNGKYKLIEYSDPKLIDVWLSVFTYYEWRKSNGR